MEERKENKMGVMPVNKLILSMSIPIMISMLVQALYNVVDSIFVARLSQDALNAVSLAFPAQNLMIGIAVGAGVGVNAYLAKSLGEKDFDEVNRVACNGIFITFLHFLLFAVFGLLFSGLYFRIQTENAVICTYGEQYLRICLILSFGQFFSILMERLLQATGRTIHTMIMQLVGALTNIILDPILIFGLFGFPRMEVAGAALATVIGQIFGMLLGIFFNLRHNPEIKIDLRGFRPNSRVIKRIYKVGIPSMVMNAVGSVMVFLFNQILLVFTEAATAVFGVYFKLQSFIFMPVFGLNNGVVPIISYNYGARRPGRIVKTIKLAIMYAVIIMLAGFAVFQLLPDKLLLMFDAGEEMLSIGTTALRIISLSFILAGYNVVCSSVFQAFGKGVLSLLMSVVRQIVVLIPVALLLSLTGRLELVWLSFPVAEIAALIIASLCLRHLYLNEIKTMS